uniref:Uncharacterized protein n=1 Tax=Rhizophora mucronata TaxID=61149 RepID=A0A2P2J5V3_RHIMU
MEEGTIGFVSDVPNLTGEVHLLPCAIKYDGPSAVSHYFKPKPTGIEVDGLTMEEAYFRGRKLDGVTLPLPPTYSGFVLGKKSSHKRKMPGTSQRDCWQTNARFQSITYWNHDCLPSEHDAFLRSFHWLSIAEDLHKPVTAEDLASASILVDEMMK